MASQFLSFNVFLAFSTLLAFTSALPIHSTVESTPAGLTGIYNGAGIDTILRRDEHVSRTFGPKFGEPILPREQTSRTVGSKFIEPILPREHTSRTLGSKFGEPILPREPKPHIAQVGENGIQTEDANKVARSQRAPRTVDIDGKPEVWEEAKFDARAEVADGRRADKGKWRTAVNQFLPS
jgi:hypothetical protein